MENKESINILCATDENYAPYCGIMLTSLFRSNPDLSFKVWIFEDGSVLQYDADKFKKLEKVYNCSVELVKVDDTMVEGFPMNPSINITKPTYYRLLSSTLLPLYVHKVLYLDNDIVVVGDIAGLWNVDVVGVAIAGAKDCYPSCEEFCGRLNYPSKYGYMNAGVAVINLDYWREERVVDQMLDFIQNNYSVLKYMDQDVINGVLFDKMTFLPERYNFQVFFLRESYWKRYSESYRLHCLEEKEEAVILHYIGRVKPWDYRYFGGPFYSVWQKCRKKSFWRGSHKVRPRRMYLRFLVCKTFCPNVLKKENKIAWVAPKISSGFN